MTSTWSSTRRVVKGGTLDAGGWDVGWVRGRRSGGDVMWSQEEECYAVSGGDT